MLSLRMEVLVLLLIGLVFSAVFSASANANSSDDKNIYRYQSKAGVTSFSDIEPIDAYYEVVRVGCFACKVHSQIDWYKTKLFLSKHKNSINKFAEQYQLDPNLIRAIIHAESHFRETVVSRAGAQGLMQLMPATARELGVNNPLKGEQNIAGGAKHLARLMNKYYGDIRIVTAAYNAGEGNVEKYGGVPPFPETRVYIERVHILYNRYRKASQT